jgi:hypothetical protein
MERETQNKKKATSERNKRSLFMISHDCGQCFMKTEFNFTQTSKPSNPTPTLALPLKGREIAIFLPFQGGGQEGDGVSVGVVLNLPYREINGTLKISALAGMTYITIKA